VAMDNISFYIVKVNFSKPFLLKGQSEYFI
jgi:hypothetical protein